MIGYGAPTKQGTSATHGAPLGDEEIAGTRAALDWDYEPFVIPDDILASWRQLGEKGAAARADWEKRLGGHSQGGEFQRRMAGELPDGRAMQDYLEGLAGDPPKWATRKASEMALGAITAALPEMVGGSADLTGSNNTKTPSTKPLTKDDYSGRYIYYGIREFGMAAAMNGMALHGGIIPYGGTFLVFTDYCRGAMRLSAIQNARVVYVMTHDSIGLGEDGPTHQPIEHIQSLRLMPNMHVYRPADAIETAECWALAIKRADGPSTLALTRQGLPPLRHDVSVNLCEKGAYRMKAAENEKRVVLVATGSEVSLAMDVAAKLEAAGSGADVISMPCAELFDAQSVEYRNELLGGPDILRVSIEAGTTIGWERYTGLDGLRFGIDSFGASAPIDDLYAHFGLTVDAITPQILKKIG